MDMAVYDKIYNNGKLLSFTDLRLDKFTVEELKFIKDIYRSKEEKIDKFIERKKYSSMDEEKLIKKLNDLEDELKTIEQKTYTYEEITDKDVGRHAFLIKEISKTEEDLRKVGKYL